MEHQTQQPRESKCYEHNKWNRLRATNSDERKTIYVKTEALSEGTLDMGSDKRRQAQSNEVEIEVGAGCEVSFEEECHKLEEELCKAEHGLVCECCAHEIDDSPCPSCRFAVGFHNCGHRPEQCLWRISGCSGDGGGGNSFSSSGSNRRSEWWWWWR